MGGEEACTCCEGEHGGLKLTANARAALMQRLSGQAAPANGLPVMGNGVSRSCLPCCGAIWSSGPTAVCTGVQIAAESNLTMQDSNIYLSWILMTDRLLSLRVAIPCLIQVVLHVQRCCQGHLQWSQLAP